MKVYRSAYLSAILLAIGLMLIAWRIVTMPDPSQFATRTDINQAVQTREAQDEQRRKEIEAAVDSRHREVIRALKQVEKGQQQHEAEIERLERRTR